jgi:hypothetical protein
LRPAAFNTWIGFFSDERKPIRLFANGFIYTEDESDGWVYGVSTTVSWRAASNLFLSVSPRMNRQHDAWQYLRTAEALGETQYMFGQLDQTTVSSTFRGNLTFTPTLSLQLYWEPFISAGNYVSYQRVVEPRAGHFNDRFEFFTEEQVIDNDGDISIDINGNGEADVGLGNPNFTYLSFRSNAVLRWEYRPGSTLFLVWQHGRTGFSNTGEFNLNQGITDLANAESANMFVVKFTYWLGR